MDQKIFITLVEDGSLLEVRVDHAVSVYTTKSSYVVVLPFTVQGSVNGFALVLKVLKIKMDGRGGLLPSPKIRLSAPLLSVILELDRLSTGLQKLTT
jgi:hypothetical protein